MLDGARHRFCAQCGHATHPAKAGLQRDCPNCGAQHFPRVDPVAIMLVECEDWLAARPLGALSAAALFSARRVRRAGREHQRRGRARGVRGDRGARARRALCRQPAVAVPLAADDRLHRLTRTALNSGSTGTRSRTRAGSRATTSSAAMAEAEAAAFSAAAAGDRARPAALVAGARIMKTICCRRLVRRDVPVVRRRLDPVRQGGRRRSRTRSRSKPASCRSSSTPTCRPKARTRRSTSPTSTAARPRRSPRCGADAGHRRARGLPDGLDEEGEEPPAMMWNTFDAHKLLRWALAEAGSEAQTRLKLALLKAHFQQRRNVSDRDVLLDVAEAEGFDRGRRRRARRRGAGHRHPGRGGARPPRRDQLGPELRGRRQIPDPGRPRARGLREHAATGGGTGAERLKEAGLIQLRLRPASRT